MPPDGADLDAILSLAVDRTVTSVGVTFLGLIYQSKELQAIRRREGHLGQKLMVKGDPNDLGVVLVLDEGRGRERGKWISVPCNYPELSDGVSIVQWRETVALARQQTEPGRQVALSILRKCRLRLAELGAKLGAKPSRVRREELPWFRDNVDDPMFDIALDEGDDDASLVELRKRRRGRPRKDEPAGPARMVGDGSSSDGAVVRRGSSGGSGSEPFVSSTGDSGAAEAVREVLDGAKTVVAPGTSARTQLRRPRHLVRSFIMLDGNPMILVRRPFAVASNGAERRAAMKARIEAIHLPDDVFRSTADMFCDLVNDIEDCKPTHAIVLRAQTGVGKSHVFDRLDDPRLAPFADAYGPCIPCVRMSAPTPCNLATLGLELHYRLTGDRLSSRARSAEVWFRLRTQLYNLGVRLIMLDEFHHLVETANLAQRQVVVSTLKSLLIGENPGPAAALGRQIGVLPDTVVRHPIGLVLAGMPILSEAIDLDHQLARRCWTVDFRRDDLAEAGGGKCFTRFLEHYERGIGSPRNRGSPTTT